MLLVCSYEIRDHDRDLSSVVWESDLKMGEVKGRRDINIELSQCEKVNVVLQLLADEQR